jgi:hypothetical protein
VYFAVRTAIGPLNKPAFIPYTALPDKRFNHP